MVLGGGKLQAPPSIWLPVHRQSACSARPYSTNPLEPDCGIWVRMHVANASSVVLVAHVRLTGAEVCAATAATHSEPSAARATRKIYLFMPRSTISPPGRREGDYLPNSYVVPGFFIALWTAAWLAGSIGKFKTDAVGQGTMGLPSSRAFFMAAFARRMK